MSTNAINNHSSDLTLDSPLLISSGGTSVSSFANTDGVVLYDGTSLINYAQPKVNSSGYMTNTAQPIFNVYPNDDINPFESNVTGDGTIIKMPFNSARFDSTSSFNLTTYEYVAPQAGKYFFNAIVMRFTGGTSTTQKLSIITTNLTSGMTNTKGMDSNQNVDGSILVSGIFDMAQNDIAYVEYQVSGGTKNIGYFNTGANSSSISFSGYLIA